jgi:hypothetical protein
MPLAARWGKDTAYAAHWVRDFPRQLIGREEIHRVLAAGDDAEAEAFICNPSVSDELLEELYKRTDAFATLPEERWRNLIYLSRKNERLLTKRKTPMICQTWGIIEFIVQFFGC